MCTYSAECRCSIVVEAVSHQFVVAGTNLLLFWRRSKFQRVAAVFVVDASTTEWYVGSTHVFNGYFTRQDDEVTPAKFLAEHCLDGFEELQGLVEVAVVWPVQLWVKTDASAVTALFVERESKYCELGEFRGDA